MKAICVTMTTVFLMSCTTLTKKDCETVNWFHKGQDDGRRGVPSQKFVDYTRTCQRHGYLPDENAYIDGRVIGLQIFCTEENGYRVGADGKEYNRVCPASLESAFLKGYVPGFKEHELNRREAELESRERELEERERKLKQEEDSRS